MIVIGGNGVSDMLSYRLKRTTVVQFPFPFNLIRTTIHRREAYQKQVYSDK